jgi:hypothetical protein
VRGAVRWLRSDWVRIAVFLLVVALFYDFVISAGHMTTWPFYSSYYDDQAEGFRAGHLYTALEPNPNLVRAANPLDYAVNRRWWNWDYSFYRGHIHIYWGLAPAVLLALAKVLFAIHERVDDAVVVFSFLLVRALLGHLTLLSLSRRLVNPPPRWAVALAAWVFALANPVPFLMARSSVYEGALAAGACFSTAALYFALRWFGSERRVRDWPLLAATSLALGLAATSRVSLFPAAAIFLVLVFLAGLWNRGALRQQLPTGPGGRDRAAAWRAILARVFGLAPALALPFTAIALAQFSANYLRFGAWNEFGTRYQMGFSLAIGPAYAPANLWSYLFHPMHWTCEFPYLTANPYVHVPRWLTAPKPYFEEPVASLLSSIPFVWLLPAPLLLRLIPRCNAARHALDEPLRWFQAVLVSSIVVATVPLLLIMAHTMRYELEFASALLIASAWAGWSGLGMLQNVGKWTRWATRACYVGLSLASIAIGVLYGFTGYYDHFASNNGKLFTTLQRTLSVCSVVAHRPAGRARTSSE